MRATFIELIGISRLLLRVMQVYSLQIVRRFHRRRSNLRPIGVCCLISVTVRFGSNSFTELFNVGARKHSDERTQPA